jgi:hypothetical protein
MATKHWAFAALLDELEWKAQRSLHNDPKGYPKSGSKPDCLNAPWGTCNTHRIESPGPPSGWGLSGA